MTQEPRYRYRLIDERLHKRRDIQDEWMLCSEEEVSELSDGAKAELLLQNPDFIDAVWRSKYG